MFQTGLRCSKLSLDSVEKLVPPRPNLFRLLALGTFHYDGHAFERDAMRNIVIGLVVLAMVFTSRVSAKTADDEM